MAKTNCKVEIVANRENVFMKIIHFGTTILIVELKSEMIYHIGGYSSTDRNLISIALGWLKRRFPNITRSKGLGIRLQSEFKNPIENSKEIAKYYVEKTVNVNFLVLSVKFNTIVKHGGILNHHKTIWALNQMQEEI